MLCFTRIFLRAERPAAVSACLCFCQASSNNQLAGPGLWPLTVLHNRLLMIRLLLPLDCRNVPSVQRWVVLCLIAYLACTQTGIETPLHMAPT
jgi:hypothetical protein